MSVELARITIFNMYIEKIGADIADDRGGAVQVECS
jgi:hypothetical protein